ncbi:MAG TPA: hypothetical protein VGQ87_02520 [Patescibacteria group bacterium]|jgi:hypothetical protein|nr:hypothetical protein [Patescibacteria group bacterium]
MPLPKESFLTFPQPFDAALDERKVNGSWPQLQNIGITTLHVTVKGVSRDETTLLVDSEPRVSGLVPQVAKRAVILNDATYEKQAAAVGLRKDKKEKGSKTEGLKQATAG